MTQIEKIIAEIERRVNKYEDDHDPVPMALKSVIDFINSLPDEQPSEELEEKIEGKINEYWNEWFSHGDYFEGTLPKNVFAAYCHKIAQWQKEQMMKSAIEVKINRDTLYNLKPIIHEKYQDLKIGDKILIIKEDEQCSTE